VCEPAQHCIGVGSSKKVNVSYEVMTTPSLEVDVKKSDGTIQHFYRDGDDIYTYVPGDTVFSFT
jgi:hypothetical protein